MNITVYEGFNKRYNSTLRPSSGSVISVALKTPTDIAEPHFILSSHHDTNYIKWDDRYYFVNDKIYLDNNNIEFVCRIDLLATYKTQIGDYRGFISRCSTGWNDDIVDECLTQKSGSNVVTSTANIDLLSSSGYYVLSAMSKGVDNTIGVSTSWVLDASNMKKLGDWFCNGGFSKALKEIFEKPLDSIYSLKYIPFSANAYSGKVSSARGLQIGGFDFSQSTVVGLDTNNPHLMEVADTFGNLIQYFKYDEIEVNSPGQVSASAFTSRSATKGVYTLTIPFPSDMPGFMKNSNFARTTVYIPMYGAVTVDTRLIKNGTITADFCLDPITGEVTVRLFGDGNCTLGLYTFNTSVEIPLGERSSNVVNSVIGGVVGVTQGILSGNIVGSVFSAVNSLQGALTPAVSTSGSVGGNSMIQLGNTMRVDVAINSHNDIDYTSVLGRPCMEVGIISAHGGYVQTERAHISLPMWSSEVSNMLDGGIYYE